MIETDALIIGAGPVGLFQVFELGLQEVHCHVVDSLPQAGGQCIELYPDKPIYDIPSVGMCTGRELAANLMEQAKPFAPTFHFNQIVTSFAPLPDGRFEVTTDTGTRFITKTMVIAAGVGAFSPRALKLDGIERFKGTQVAYHFDAAANFAGQQVMILGGDDAALDAAMAIASAGSAKSICLMHRRDVFAAPDEKVAQVQSLCNAKKMRFVAGQPIALQLDGERLVALTIATPEGQFESLPVDQLIVLLGLSPKLGPLAQWGLAMQRKQLEVNTATFSTSLPSIFAVGDINTYPGKKKLIVCGFHEATLAAFGIAEHLRPNQAQPLQYTTTSKRLHALLGVAPVLDEAAPSHAGLQSTRD